MPQTVSTTQRDSLDLSERHVNGRPAISIPVDDPEAALQFCRRLAALVEPDGALAPRAQTP